MGIPNQNWSNSKHTESITVIKKTDRLYMHQNNPDVTIYDLRSPTLEYSEKDPDNVDVFYNGLKSVIKNFKSRDNLVIAGDSN